MKKAFFSDIHAARLTMRWLFIFIAGVTQIIFIPNENLFAFDNNLPFSPGEKLTFQLKWTIFPAGEATLEILPKETINGVQSYHFVLTAKSNSFIDHFYKVRDRIDAYADMEMLRTIFYKKKQHEGKRKKDATVYFDWEKNKAQYTARNSKREPIDILSGSFDPLSAFYYVRLFRLKENIKIERPVTDGKKCVIGQVIVIKRETLKLSSGTYDTYLIEPDLKDVGGVFEKSKNAKIQLWVTADNRCIPVKIRSKVVVGSFVGELVSATGLKPDKNN